MRMTKIASFRRAPCNFGFFLPTIQCRAVFVSLTSLTVLRAKLSQVVQRPESLYDDRSLTACNQQEVAVRAIGHEFVPPNILRE